MAKKGNMNIDNDDFNFDDEMFPLDDSVYSDDDDLAGFSFNPNSEEKGVKGFFINTIKSIKGIGLDFADEFLPEMVSLTDDIKSSMSDTKDAFLDKKDKLVEGIADFKSSIARKDKADTAKEVKKGFSEVFSNIKKGKFYTSNRDMPIDMDSMFGDDDEGVGSSEPEDTSGKMTTKFNYKTPRSKRVNNIFVTSNNDAAAMAEIQESATVATATINTKLAKAQIRNNNQNFYETLNILKNIDDNIYGLSKFLTHYGKTNINAALEFDSKALAFLTDQRALLKDILIANNRAIGIKTAEEEARINAAKEEADAKNIFSFGSFDMSKYTKNIMNNAKDMFAGTQIGGALEMASGMSNMFGKKSGMNLNPMQIASSMAKSFLFNQMLGTDTKNKLERMNDLFGNIGGTLITSANKWKDSNNPFLSFMGNLMGTDRGINKHIDLNTEDINSQTVFDIKTKETINEVIPGYLAQITAALTGGKLTYYNHASKQFEERDSIGKKYQQVQENAINSNIKFTSGMNFVMDGLLSNNGKKGKAINKQTLVKGMEKFKKNLIESKAALDIFSLTHGDKDYSDKLFRGFESIDPDNTESLKSAIISQLATLQPNEIADINNSIFRVASEVESAARNFKTEAIKNGSLTAIAELNEQERWAEIDYNKKYSSQYNEDLAGDNEFAKRRARMNVLKLNQESFMDRVGKVSLSDKFSVSSSASGQMTDIYRLLLNGIKVYPSTDKRGLEVLKELGATFDKNELDKLEKQRKEDEDYVKLREDSARSSAEQRKLEFFQKNDYRFKGAKDDSFIGQLRDAVGIDRLVGRAMGALSKPLEIIYGKEATQMILNDGGFDKETLEELEKYREETKSALKNTIKSGTDTMSKYAKSNKKLKGIDKVIGTIEKGKSYINNKLEVTTSKLKDSNAKKAVEREKKAINRLKDIEKNGTIWQRAFGHNFVNTFNNIVMEASSTAKSKVYVDPDWLGSLDEKSPIKTRLFNMLISNSAIISTTLEEDCDVAFYKSATSEEKQLMKANGIFEIKASAKNIQLLKSYLNSSGFTDEAMRRSRIRASNSNNSVSDYRERDSNLNKRSYDMNSVIMSGVSSAQKEYDDYNKAHNKESEDYKKLSSKEQKQIEKVRQELFDNLKAAKRAKIENKITSGDNSVTYKYINRIVSAKTAGKIFLDPKCEAEINELLSSNDRLAILKFANIIKSNKEGKLSQAEKLSALDKQFKERIENLFNDAKLLNKGVSIKESVRSPLFHFALYSKGRTDPNITGELLKYAGYSEGLNYFPEEIRYKMGPDGITVRSLASNHLTGRAVDLNNGSLSYKALANIASGYGIKWAGEKDKPHFEFDPSFKMGPMTAKETKQSIKGGSILSAKNIQKEEVKLNKSETTTFKVSGKPIELYQNDPVDTVVSGKFRSATVNGDSSIRDILLEMNEGIIRIGNNTENIGFRMGIPGKIGHGLFGKVGDTLKSFGSKFKTVTGTTFDFAKDGASKIWDFGTSAIGKGLGLAKAGFENIKNNIGGIKKMSPEELIVKFKLDEYLKMSPKQILKKYSKEELVKICKQIAAKEGIVGKAKDAAKGLWSKGKDLGGTLFDKGKELLSFGTDKLKSGISGASELLGKGKDFLLGKMGNVHDSARNFLKEKLNLSDEEIANMSDTEILKMALDNGFEATKAGGLNLFGKATDTVKGILNKGKGILSGISGGISFGGGIGFSGKSIISKMDEIIDAIYDVNGRERPAKSINNETIKSSFATKLGNFGEHVGNAAKQFSNGVSDTFGKIKNKFTENTEEGSYEDQKNDKETKEEKESRRGFFQNIKDIASVVGSKESMMQSAKDSAKPDLTIASLLMANHQNSEKQNELLEEIKEKEDKSGGAGLLGKFGAFGGKLAAGAQIAGNLVTVGGAAAGAAMIAKQIHNKFKANKLDAKNATFGEKISKTFGLGGSSNYDANGNKIEDVDVKKGNGFGLKSIGSAAGFANVVTSVSKAIKGLSGVVKKIFTNKKVISKLGGEATASAVEKVFMESMEKTLKKGGPKLLSKVSGKISGLLAKASNPAGWAIALATFLADLASGMSEANRYFKMGKGMKPTWPMRLTSGLAKALCNLLTFGLLPAETVASFIYNKIAKDSTKRQMEEAAIFDKKRAKIMEVEYERFIEFETMTWSEKFFGRDKKRATILGFMKGKKDKDGKERFKTWFDQVYKPLDDMYRDMVKAYGGKVDKVVKEDDVAGLENRDKFRAEYLKSAENYMSTNKLYGLGPLGKTVDKFTEENNKAATENSEAELETEAKISEETTVEMANEGVDVKGATSSSSALSASLPKNETESSVSTPTNKIQVNDPKVTQTTGTITNKPETTKDSGKPGQNKNVQQSAIAVGGKVVSGNMSQEDYEARRRLMDLKLRGQIYKTDGNMSYPVRYIYDEANKIYIPDTDMLDLDGEELEKFMNENPYYDSNGYEVDKKTLQRKSSKVAENAQADGINYGKINDSSYTNQWEKASIKALADGSKVEAQAKARVGIKDRLKNGLSSVSGKVKNIAKFAKNFVSKAVKGSLLYKLIKGPAEAIANFIGNRKQTEAEVSTMFNDPSGKDILKLQDGIVDKGALGQQTSSANLSPEFAQRVEAFLKDPRIANHGVRIREGYRSPATQLAYFSKGRAPNSITDKLMKKAGFRDGINFWAKSFQKPGDYITWTLASNHFNGTAVDLEPGDLGYDKLGSIAAEYGIDWGGNWSTPDKPHFEMGDPNYSLASLGSSSGSSSEAEVAQADTINFDKMLSSARKTKAYATTKSMIKKASTYTNPISSIARKSMSRISGGVKTAFNKVNNTGMALAEKSGEVTSNLISSKFDELLSITTEGVDIMRDLYEETKRHNAKEEKMLENVIKGLGALGAIMAAANNGGYSSAGNPNSITKGIFDNLAKGL